MDKDLQVIVKAIDDKKGTDILIYEYSALNPFIDYTVIASANNQRQVYAIADSILDCAREHGICVKRMEGNRDSRWILIDLHTIIVHVFLDEEREVYRLEQLYADLPTIPCTL